MPVEEIGVTGVNVGCLHANQVPHQLVSRIHALLEEGDDNGVEFLLQHGVSAEQLFVQKLTEDPDKLVIDQRDTLQAWVFHSPDLMLDDQLECGGTDEQGRRGTGRVVKDRTNVDILHDIEGIHSLDPVRVELVEYKANTSTARKLNARQLRALSFQDCAVFIAEFCDDVQDNIRAVAKHRVTELRKLRAILLQGRRNAGFDVGQGLFDVHHENLYPVSKSATRAAKGYLIRTKFNFLARYGVPQ